MRTLDAAEPGAPPQTLAPAAAGRVSPGAVVLAVALPVLFLHVMYQSSAALPFGGTFKLQDAAALAVALAALVTALRDGVSRLRPALPVWIAALLFLGWLALDTIVPLASSAPYPWRTHLVTAAEFVEYAVLAPAVPLLVRRRADALLVLGMLVGWAAVASAVGVLQFAGAHVFHPWPAHHRQPSFVGSHEFGGLEAAAIGVGFVGLLWHVRERRLRMLLWAAVAVGLVGFALDASVAAIAGLVPAALVTAWVAGRRGLVSRRWIAAALAGVVAATCGVVALRANDLDQFLRFAGLRHAEASTSRNVQTYSQRTVLAYIGFEVWLDHPVAGAGWEATLDPATLAPVLPAAHARFPDVAARAFPSPAHEFGIQLLYVQALSDLGVIGLALLLGVLAVPLVLGLRTALRAPPEAAAGAALGVFWLLVVLGLFLGIGLVAGIPTDALFWLSLGAVATGAAAAWAGARGTMDG